jgi:hypothetical protein
VPAGVDELSDAYAYIPKGLPGSVKPPRLHLSSSVEGTGGEVKRRVPDCLIYICPNHRRRIFLSSPLPPGPSSQTLRKGKTGRCDKLPRVKASACIHLHGVSTVIGTIPHSRARNERRALLGSVATSRGNFDEFARGKASVEMTGACVYFLEAAIPRGMLLRSKLP